MKSRFSDMLEVFKFAEKYDIEEMVVGDAGIVSFKRNASLKYERHAAEKMQKVYESMTEKSKTATDEEILMNPFAGMEQ